jgi:hypothetical protein
MFGPGIKTEKEAGEKFMNSFIIYTFAEYYCVFRFRKVIRGLCSAFGWKQNAHNSFVGIYAAKIWFGRPQFVVRKYNIKMDPNQWGVRVWTRSSFLNTRKRYVYLWIR